jgi:hypothetical protein
MRIERVDGQQVGRGFREVEGVEHHTIVGDGKWLKYINMIDIQINLAIMNIEKKKFCYRRRYLWS